MAGKKSKKKDVADDGEEAEKGGKLKLIIGAVVLLVAGVVLGGKVLGGGGATASAADATTTTTEPDGPITTLDPITLNLADGRFLKLGVAFEVHHDEDYPAPEGADDEITKGFARELDATIMVMSAFTYEDLAAPGGRAQAKTDLLAALVDVSDGAIRDVLFHEFVMQ